MPTPSPNLTILDIPIGVSPQIVMMVVLMFSFVLFCFFTRLSKRLLVQMAVLRKI